MKYARNFRISVAQPGTTDVAARRVLNEWFVVDIFESNVAAHL